MTVVQPKEEVTLAVVTAALQAEGLSEKPLVNFITRMEREAAKRKELARKTALATKGFVAVKQRTGDENAEAKDEPIMYGIYVEGHQNNRDTIARILQADSRAPAWFQDAIRKEEANPTGLQFRVRVGGISNRGRTAYVWPIAHNLEQAKNEWKREQKLLRDTPKSVAECTTPSELAELAYKHYAEANKLVIVRFDPTNYQALMVEEDDTTFLYLVTGGADIWDFTGGIIKGFTSFDEEIKRAVKLTYVTRR